MMSSVCFLLDFPSNITAIARRAGNRDGSDIYAGLFVFPVMRLHVSLPAGHSIAESPAESKETIMNDSTKDQAQGKAHEVKGAIKQAAGHLTGNPKMETEGQDEKIMGKVQKKVGQVEKVFEK